MGLALKKKGEAITKIKEALRIGNPRIRKKKDFTNYFYVQLTLNFEFVK